MEEVIQEAMEEIRLILIKFKYLKYPYSMNDFIQIQGGCRFLTKEFTRSKGVFKKLYSTQKLDKRIYDIGIFRWVLVRHGRFSI